MSVEATSVAERPADRPSLVEQYRLMALGTTARTAT
ncbi:MAG: hypothetical protein K0T00_2714 [Gaiellaceae bacterium]|nr:hypothetical protein [Gaiellaceae bacterium]